MLGRVCVGFGGLGLAVHGDGVRGGPATSCSQKDVGLRAAAAAVRANLVSIATPVYMATEASPLSLTPLTPCDGSSPTGTDVVGLGHLSLSLTPTPVARSPL